jgi:hypothetical protein
MAHRWGSLSGINPHPMAQRGRHRRPVAGPIGSLATPALVRCWGYHAIYGPTMGLPAGGVAGRPVRGRVMRRFRQGLTRGIVNGHLLANR